jgi:predicted  nucleic acid-binding Zn-ribbon protein
MKAKPFNIDKLFIDCMTTLMVLFAGLFAIQILQAKIASKDQSSAVIGNITVSAEWERGSDVDVDLWVKAPFDDKAVGYARRSDRQTSYLRDDVGTANDLSDLNYEIAAIRGLKPGRYVVNLHLYNARGAPLTHVIVKADLIHEGSSSVTKIATRELDLVTNDQELTAFSFELDDAGDLIDGSVSKAFIPLRHPEGMF